MNHHFIRSRSRQQFVRVALCLGICGALGTVSGACAMAADEDSVIARNLYNKPLTYRESPRGFRNKPLQYMQEPYGFKEKPYNWAAQPPGYREKPIPQLDEPRNGYENPFNFVARDSITVANLDESLKTAKDQVPTANANPDLRISTTSVEETQIADKVESRNPGYKGINPPNKARLQNFQ